MKKLIAIVVFGATSLGIHAQTIDGKEAIRKLCGCFEVEFRYAETFSPDPNYKYHDREEINGGVELAIPIEVTDKKIVIQHLLVITDSMIVKHWREEWSYENPVLWVYKGDRTWVKEIQPAAKVKGKWTQTVWEVADEPRYQGYSAFVSLDGKTIWQNTTDAPLPRREYSVRNDYNVLKRTNRLNITDSGYIHEQDNEKIIRSNIADQLLTQEKGINSYRRINDSQCAAANFYWEKNKLYWGKVRQAWNEYISTQTVISLKTKVDGRLLHEYLIDLAKDYAAKKVSDAEIDARIKADINLFIGRDTKTVAHP